MIVGGALNAIVAAWCAHAAGSYAAETRSIRSAIACRSRLAERGEGQGYLMFVERTHALVTTYSMNASGSSIGDTNEKTAQLFERALPWWGRSLLMPWGRTTAWPSFGDEWRDGVAAGWPFRSLACAWDRHRVGLAAPRGSRKRTTEAVSGGFAFVSDGDVRLVPWHPVLPGLILGAFVYAVPPALVGWIIGRARRAHRRRRGCCPECAYDLLGDFTRRCPECGMESALTKPHPPEHATPTP